MSAFKKTFGLSILALSVAQASHVFAVTPMTGNEVEARVGAMLDNMNTAEKINFTRVDDGRMIPKFDKHNLQGTIAYDSAMGVHVNGGTFGAQYPSPSALAATWSINRAKEFGLAIGYETRAAGGQQMLSPAVNLYRLPYGGRAAEYMSGEDPFLGSVLAPAVVNGIQVQGIQANAKHYVANDQEANRHFVDIHVDERTLRELYLPQFESMVKNSNVSSVMCGYNKVNGDYACENHHLLTEILKGEWGFQGFVMSDFNSVNDAFKGAWAGTDIDMPSGLQFTEAKLMPYLWSGQLTQNVIDDKVRRNLRGLVSYGFDKGLNKPTGLTEPEHGMKASLNVARESIVLLKNGQSESQPILPLDHKAKVAVIGKIAEDIPGSPFGTPYSPPNSYVTELSGIEQLSANSSNVDFIEPLALDPKNSVWYQPSEGQSAISNLGLKAEYFANTALSGKPAVTRIEPGVNWDFTTGQNITRNGITSASGFATTGGAFSARFTGTIKPTIDGEQVFKVRADGAYKLWVNDELIIDEKGEAKSFDLLNALTNSGKTVKLKAGKTYNVKLEYRRLQGNFTTMLGGMAGIQMSWAALAAPEELSKYDAIVMSVGFNHEYEGEASDRGFDLPEYQSDLIRSVSKVNPNTIVVMHGGGGMNMLPWSKKAGAVLHAWYSGQQGGQALAEILYGKVNPSGKLPISLEKKVQDNPAYASYPDPDDYVNNNPDPIGNKALTDITYKEGVFLGYRGYDKTHIKPLYPFGYGLSYTTFAYSDLKLSSNIMTPGATINATFTLTNTGKKAGFEVAQLYVNPLNASIDRPKKELKGFVKVYLKPGQSKKITIPVDGRSLAYFDTKTWNWVADAGKYKIEVGSSSVDLPLSQRLTTLYTQQLTTRDSNPLPLAIQKAVQVEPLDAY